MQNLVTLLLFLYLLNDVAKCKNNTIPDSRIIAGDSAKLGQFPWEVEIQINTNFAETSICSGSLVRKNFVLSAAHCFKAVNTIDVIMGHIISGLNHNPGKVVYRKLTKVFINPNFEKNDISSSSYDLALVLLPVYAPLSDVIRTIDTPSSQKDKNKKYINVIATVVGWGKVTPDVNSHKLLYADVKILPIYRCQIYYKSFAHSKAGEGLEERLLCVIGNSQMICSGDSGGPLVYVHNGKTVLIGIAVFVYKKNPCVDTDIPQGFIRLVAHIDWIEDIFNLPYEEDFNYRYQSGNSIHFKNYLYSFRFVTCVLSVSLNIAIHIFSLLL